MPISGGSLAAHGSRDTRPRAEDLARHLGPRADGHPLRARRLPAGARGRDDRRAGAARRRGARRPDRRLRVPLPAGAQTPTTSTRSARRSAAHDIYCIATGLHLDPRFGKGGLVSPDPATRAEAVAGPLEAADFAGELGAHFIVWPGIEGYNYPFQTPYAERWAWLVDGIGQAARALQATTGSCSSSSTRTPSRR